MFVLTALGFLGVGGYVQAKPEALKIWLRRLTTGPPSAVSGDADGSKPWDRGVRARVAGPTCAEVSGGNPGHPNASEAVRISSVERRDDHGSLHRKEKVC